MRTTVVLSAFLLGILLIFSMSALSASAYTYSPYLGADNAEFGTNGTTPTYVDLSMGFNTTMAWSSSPPGDLVSMQYNPDYGSSALYQYQGDWFQSGIVTDTAGCLFSTVQVYNSVGSLVYSVFNPTSGCTANRGTLWSSATWYIDEGVNSNGKINAVDMAVDGGCGLGCSFTGNINPTTNWIWLKSQYCWCGTGGGSTTFSSAGGTASVTTNVNTVTISGPPGSSGIGTGEDSNMLYGCYSGSNPANQGFGLGSKC